ncbi:MAG: glycosyltransferase [Candidatus Atabeyarchaeum deiterrae]
MRILIVTEYFAPAWGFGGPPKVLFEIARELVKRGHLVTVFTTNVLDEQRETEKSYDVLEGIKVFYLRTLSRWLAWNTKVFIPIGLRKLLREKIERFDIILLASIRTIFNLLCYHYARKFGKPYVLFPYGSLPRGTGLKKLMKWVIDPLFGYRTLRDASMVLAQTQHEMQEARKYGASNSAVKLMPLNVDFSEFRILPPRGNFRRKLDIESNEKVILFLGRLHKYKGLDLLVQSFSMVSEKKKQSKLVIVGRDDGYLQATLRLIKALGLGDKVVLTGPLYGKDRIEAYVDADVFVMPSLHFEETSKAALEACASSTPVIVTKQASIPGLDEHQAGITINYDRRELEEAILKILNNEQLKEKMGKSARLFVEKAASLTDIVDQLERNLSVKQQMMSISRVKKCR